MLSDIGLRVASIGDIFDVVPQALDYPRQKGLLLTLLLGAKTVCLAVNGYMS